MSGPLGMLLRRSGMFSQYAWNAAARRARKRAVVSLPSQELVFSGISSAQLLSTSWSSNTTSHGAAACAACRSASDLYCPCRWR